MEAHDTMSTCAPQAETRAPRTCHACNMPTPDSDAVERAALTACDELGIDGDDRVLVEMLVQQPVALWPGCCDSGCLSCVEPVRRAAARALTLLERDQG